MAKSRVAPKREAKNCDNVTIPRLELCGALLLAEMTKKALKALEIDFQRVCLWSDSKIVLDWIYANPRRYKTFIASRISKINSLVQKELWSHVRSEDNAADCASRGLLPSELANHSLWWYGPQFLINNSLETPRYTPSEKLQVNCNVAKSATQEDQFLWPNVSTNKYPYTSLKRIVGYCFCFAHNCRNKQKRTDALTYDEMQNAERAIIKIVLQFHFAKINR